MITDELIIGIFEHSVTGNNVPGKVVMVMYLCSVRGIHAVITCIRKIKGLSGLAANNVPFPLFGLLHFLY